MAVSKVVIVAASSAATTRTTHTLEILRSLETVLSTLNHAETGVRDYLLTGEERYLEPYIQASTGVPATLSGLPPLLADSPALAARFPVLRKLAEDHLVYLGQTIARRRAGDVASLRVRIPEGKARLDAARQG